MLTENDARKIGIRACMDKIGYDFCVRNKDKTATAYGRDGINMFCFVGIDDNPNQTPDTDTLTLSSVKGFSYCAGCNVNMENGDVEYLDINDQDIQSGLKTMDQDDNIVITKIEKKKYNNLSDYLESFYGKPIDEIYVESETEIDTGEPVGGEIW